MSPSCHPQLWPDHCFNPAFERVFPVLLAVATIARIILLYFQSVETIRTRDSKEKEQTNAVGTERQGLRRRPRAYQDDEETRDQSKVVHGRTVNRELDRVKSPYCNNLWLWLRVHSRCTHIMHAAVFNCSPVRGPTLPPKSPT